MPEPRQKVWPVIRPNLEVWSGDSTWHITESSETQIYRCRAYLECLVDQKLSGIRQSGWFVTLLDPTETWWPRSTSDDLVPTPHCSVLPENRQFISRGTMQYWRQRADDRLGNPPPMYPRVSNGQKQRWNTPKWAWGEQIRVMRYFLPSVLWHYWLCDRKGIRPIRPQSVGMLLVTNRLELFARLIAPAVTLTTTSIILTPINLERWHSGTSSPG